MSFISKTHYKIDRDIIILIIMTMLTNDILYTVEKYIPLEEKKIFSLLCHECNKLINIMKVRIMIMDIKFAKILMIEHAWQGYYNQYLRDYILRVPYGLVYNYINHIKYTTVDNYLKNLPIITIHMATEWTIKNKK
jgi:hypothetical protein